MIKSVLIIDDSPTAQMVLKRCLEISVPQIEEFLVAPNGEEALSKLNTRKIDLIITDINMPIMDGREFLTKIKKSPQLLVNMEDVK